MKTREEFLKEYTGNEFRYRLLSRMQSDCEFYINVEMPNNCPKEYNHLWANNDPETQIAYMRYLWESFADDDKPEWLTMDKINEYAKRMGVIA